MLSCDEVERQLSDDLDGELSPWARLQLRLHLLVCRPCAALRSLLQRTVDTLGALRQDEELERDDG